MMNLVLRVTYLEDTRVELLVGSLKFVSGFRKSGPRNTDTWKMVKPWDRMSSGRQNEE